MSFVLFALIVPLICVRKSALIPPAGRTAFDAVRVFRGTRWWWLVATVVCYDQSPIG